MHFVEMDHRTFEPENGLMLGNGDLAVSIFQAEDQLIWRFGKNDVWDRRHDVSDDPEPGHIDEIARGVRDEGWVSKEYVYGEGEATKGTSDPKRMNELCNGTPSYACRPYPCPKPVGELAMHLPTDLHELKIKQKLTIEKGVADIHLEWRSGASIDLTCFVAPEPNALVVKWKVNNWTFRTSVGIPVWFTLYRWPDPPVEQMAVELMMRARYKYFWGSIDSGKCTPLPPPELKEILGRMAVEQKFYPDLEYEDGFRLAMLPFVDNMAFEAIEPYNTGFAAMHLRPEEEPYPLTGSIVVAVPTSTDEGGVEGEAQRVIDEIGDDLPAAVDRLTKLNEESADEFWGKSSLDLGDKNVERAWYETLHLRRCSYRAGVVSPGLGMPSTIMDYSLWHGDYHTNFNFQQPFWGDYGSNHISLGDSFFPGVEYMRDIGRKVAEKYWDCRGVFISLAGYPFKVNDDVYATGPLSRMAYMTGWFSNHFWSRYLHTQDEEWLRDYGYPMMRESALFYTDFLKKWDDGKYHSFPSLQGESFFTGDAEAFTDQPQVMRHARYCMQTAVEAAQILGLDEDLQSDWKDRIDNMVVIDDLDELGFTDEEKRRYYLNPPAFLAPDAGRGLPRPKHEMDDPMYKPQQWGGGINMMPWWGMIAMHNRVYVAERDLEGFGQVLAEARHDNGTMPAMSQAGHAYIGLYGEALGITAPINEMLLQSWDGILRPFAQWPASVDASFQTLRAEGAFLVSAVQKDGDVTSLTILSEKGRPCTFESPWDANVSVADSDGNVVPATGSDGILTFETRAGVEYQLTKVS